MNYSDLHKAPSQSSEQGAPERIWLDMNDGYPVIFFVKGTGLLEYTRSDICAALVDAAEAALRALESSASFMSDGRNEIAKTKLRTALSQVKRDDK